MRTKVEAYIEESTFKNEKGEEVEYLRLVLPVTDTVEKYLKGEQFALQLAKERAKKNTFISNLKK